MLHFAYAPFSMTGAEAMSFRAKRGIQCGSAKEFNRAGMANLILPVPLLQKESDVSASQKQGKVDTSLGFASLSMTVHLAGSRVIIGSIRILFSECAFT